MIRAVKEGSHSPSHEVHTPQVPQLSGGRLAGLARGASHDWVMFRGEEGRGITATVAGKHLIFGTDRNYFYVMEEVF